MNSQRTRDCLKRMAARGGSDLKRKTPHWGDAILCDGLLYAAKALSFEAPAIDAAEWFSRKLSTGPRIDGWIWYWSAEALPSLDLHLRTGEQGYLDYARAAVRALETRAARTRDGAIVPHPPAQEVWVDISYFSAPAMARLGRILSDAAMVERALDQLLVHQRYLQDQSSALFWHVAYVDQGSHSPCLWARGNSWFSIAVPEVISEVRLAGLGPRFADKTEALSQALVKQLQAVASLQDQGGLWHTIIDRSDSYLEASASAGFALALGRALAMRLRGLDATCAREAYHRAIAALCGKIDDHGQFTGVSQQTPPGDFAFYNSIELGSAPFGTGVCLMALSESVEFS